MSEKPYAPSCDENRDVILAVLRPRLQGVRRLLEIGSGTGQHAVYFAPALPHIIWQTSELEQHLPGLQWWLADHPAANLLPPIILDVATDRWPAAEFDAVFSANTVHMMDATMADAMLSGVARLLPPEGRFLLYGPFKKDGNFNGPNDREFDLRLRRHDPAIGLKDIAGLDRIAAANGLTMVEEIAMPANNFVLIWDKNSQPRRTTA
jgi:cyclopropane fatty-acyl-phospholipid synthase-like methyltransferase